MLFCTNTYIVSAHTQGSQLWLRGFENDPWNLKRFTPAEEEVIAPHIHIKNATLAYKQQVIFSKLNMTLPAGKWVGLLGPSGVGKSSLLRMIAGLTTSQETLSGEVMTNNAIPAHQQMAYMAQTDLLLPWLNVLDNVTVGFKLHHDTELDNRAYVNKAKILLEQVGLHTALHLYPAQLSGGMRQRVALVRTLMQDKPIILMDEPFSSLDAITRYKLQSLAADLLRHKTVLFVTHDPTECLRLSHDIYIMQHQPAMLKHILHLDSPTPRDLSAPDVIQHQALLFRELTLASEVS